MSSFILAAGMVLMSHGAMAQTPTEDRFGIKDNSFLIEEAFNQETGIFQNIFVMTRSRDGQYDGSVTQEWPVPAMRHQLSFTMPFSAVSGQGSAGDLMLNYRFQAWSGEGRLPAFSPRLSVIMPTSVERRPLGRSGVGWQVNLPFSREVGPLFLHWNVGTTLQQDSLREGVPADWQQTPFAGGSLIAAVTPLFNLMVESLVEWQPTDSGRERKVTVAPGIRTGWNIGSKQVVLGLAFPTAWSSTREAALLTYFSYELPFKGK